MKHYQSTRTSHVIAPSVDRIGTSNYQPWSQLPSRWGRVPCAAGPTDTCLCEEGLARLDPGFTRLYRSATLDAYAVLRRDDRYLAVCLTHAYDRALTKVVSGVILPHPLLVDAEPFGGACIELDRPAALDAAKAAAAVQFAYWCLDCHPKEAE